MAVIGSRRGTYNVMYGRGYPRTRRGAEARDRPYQEAESSVLTKAQTGPRCDERSREARTEIEGNHERITVRD